MLYGRIVAAFLAVPLLACAAPNVDRRFANLVTHETRSRFPQGWRKVEDGLLNKASTSLPFRINLKQSSMDRAYDMLMDVSHPESPNYAKHLTPDEIIEAFAPSKDTVELVSEWLESAGFTKDRVTYSKAKGALLIDMTIAEAEKLFSTTYHMFEHESGVKNVACSEYSIPAFIQSHVDFATPTLHFDKKLPMAGDGHSKRAAKMTVKPTELAILGQSITVPADPTTAAAAKIATTAPPPSRPLNTTNCDQFITPDCLAALYGYGNYKQKATARNSYGIVEYTPQSLIPSDIDVFAQRFNPAAIGYRPKFVSIDGGALQPGDPLDISVESNLDIEYAIGVTYPLNITLYQTGDNIEGASFSDFLDAFDASFCKYDNPDFDAVYPDPYGPGYEGPKDCGTKKLTNVVSTSYAYNEADLTPAYEKRQCNEYLKLGLSGTTFVFSSGDYGVAGNRGQCLTPDGDYSVNGTVFNPSFPSGCPYVTSIGATEILKGNTVKDPEQASQSFFFSGGGFSNVFPLPLYQKFAVAEYYRFHKPPYTAAQYNNTQRVRGFPDISANGNRFAVAINGKFYSVYGTSASAPVIGGIISLINDARLAKGKRPVGFINPVLYTFPWAMKDIIGGGQNGCGTTGFGAVSGWDPTTGLGTPQFDRLLPIFLTLP